MQQDDATGAAAKKGIRWLGNGRGSGNQVSGARGLLDIDTARFRACSRQAGEGETIPPELPGRSGKATGGHEEPQQGVVQGW